MGNMNLAASSSSGSGSYTFLIVIVVLFGLLYFVMIRPQRNRQRAVQEKQRQVQPGQRVRTTAGMYATVLEADDEDVLLEVAPGVQIRFLRKAVMEVLPDDDGMAGYGGADGDVAEDTVAEDEPAAAAETTTPPAASTPPVSSTDEVNGDAQGSAGHRNGSAPDGTVGGRTATGEHTAD
jgi:preprotein translocase subunit YajC